MTLFIAYICNLKFYEMMKNIQLFALLTIGLVFCSCSEENKNGNSDNKNTSSSKKNNINSTDDKPNSQEVSLNSELQQTEQDFDGEINDYCDCMQAFNQELIELDKKIKNKKVKTTDFKKNLNDLSMKYNQGECAEYGKKIQSKYKSLEEFITVCPEMENLISNVDIMGAKYFGAQWEDFMNKKKKSAKVKATKSGLMYEVMKMGKGAKPGPTSRVTVHYHGTTPEGEIFDSSVDRGEPSTFGLNQVIAGWTEGLQLMPEGSKFKFYIPQNLAYGANPMPGGPIKPYMPLVFEVELIKINS